MRKKTKRVSLDEVFSLDTHVDAEPVKVRKRRGRPKKEEKVEEPIQEEVVEEVKEEPKKEEVKEEPKGIIMEAFTDWLNSAFTEAKDPIDTPTEQQDDEIDKGMEVLPPDQSHIPVTPDLLPPEVKPEDIEEDDALDLEDAFSGSEVVEFNIGTGIGEKTDFKLPQELMSNVKEFTCDDKTNMGNIAFNNISGVKLIGTYFNIRGDRHEATTTQSISIDGVLQAYNLIINAVLFASKALDETKFEEMSIEALLAMGIVPRVNDYFAFKAFDGRLLFFIVREIERVGYGSREVHKLTLNFAFDSVTGMNKIQDMMSKIVDTLYYDHNSQTLGEQSLLTPEDLALRDQLGDMINEMKDFYDQRFLDPEYGIYNLYSRNNGLDIDLPYLLYDPYVANFFQSLVCFNDNVYTMGNYTPEIKLKDRGLNFFTAIRNKEAIGVKLLHPYYGGGRLDNDKIDAFLKNILLLSGSRVVLEYRDDGYAPYPDMELLLERNYERELTKYPLHNKTPNDNFYIFTESFYNRDAETMSAFEKSMVRLIEKQPIDIKDYLPYFKSYRFWSVYEQFYIIPILIYIARKVRKGITKFK